MSDPKDKAEPNPDSEGSGKGLSVLDLASLSPLELRIMRVLLREVELGYADLCSTLERLPAAEQMSRQQIDETITQLVDTRWLMLNDGLYRVNLARKSTRNVSDFAPPRQRTSGSTLRNIWDSIEHGGKKDDPKP